MSRLLLAPMFMMIGAALAATACGIAPPPSNGSASTGATGGDGIGGQGSSSSTGGQGGSGGATDLTPKTYDADDARILLTGRMDLKDPKHPTFSAPGAYVTARFRGVGASVILEDAFLYGNYRNFYEVILDGQRQTLAPVQGTSVYPVATGLPNTEHTLVIAKRTESALGTCRFGGFVFEGEIAAPPLRPSRRMIVIGDSISAGSGDEATSVSQCMEDCYYKPGGFGTPYQNAWITYGATAARLLDAEVHLTAVSGIGMVRNYSSVYDGRPMPQVYGQVFLEQNPGQLAWDTSKFVPDAVVIGLGTNDWSPGDSPRPPMTANEFATAYIAFLDTLLGYYPAAHFFCLSSPMLGDGYPNGQASDTEQKQALDQVVQHYAAKGNQRIHKVVLSHTTNAPESCYHPNVADQALLGQQVATAVKAELGW